MAEPPAERAAAFRGPVVIVSWSALGMGALGQTPSDTPELDRFRAEASWSGVGIASSSWCGGSMASVLTGVSPALHGAGHPAHPWLLAGVRTLAEELGDAGFATSMFYASPWLGARFGIGRGFAAQRPLRRRAAERHLAALGSGPSLTWIQIPLPGAAALLAGSPAEEDTGLAEGGDAGDEPPGAAPYRDRVREGDRRFGRLMDALRRSGRAEEAVVIVLADHGPATGEEGAPLPGESIGRDSVEVPLALRVPSALRPRIGASAGVTVGLDRLFATVAELAGARPSPAAAPSLLRSPAWVAVSELWFANGYHEIGVYEDGHQLRWRCRFAPEDPSYAAARREAFAPWGSARYGELVSGLESAFRERPQCALGEEILLERWPAQGGAIAVEDAARGERLLDRIRHLRSFPPVWSLAPPRPLPVMQRRELRGLSGWGLPLPAQWAPPRG